MRSAYIIDEDRRTIVIRFAGPFDAGQFIACIERLWADPAYDREFEGIADITEVEPTYTVQDAQRLIAFLKENPMTNTARWAVITASPVAVAMSYIYQRAMASVHHIEVFSTWEAAGAYIGWTPPRPGLAVKPV